MKVKRAHSYNNLVGRRRNVLLAVVHDRKFIDRASIIYRACYESNSFTKTERFKPVEYAYTTLYSEAVILPLALERKGCVFVEVVDTITNTSVVILLRHVDYASPYNIDERLVTTLEVVRDHDDDNIHECDTSDEEEMGDEVDDFLADVFKLGEGLHTDKVQVTNVETVLPQASDFITKELAEYAADKVVNIPTKDKRANFIVGVNWCDREHWMSLNGAQGLGYRITPSSNALSSVSVPIELTNTITAMSASVINTMCANAALGAMRRYRCPFEVPNLPSSVSSRLDAYKQELYNKAVASVQGALLTALYSKAVTQEEVYTCDYEETSCLLYRKNYYGWDNNAVLRNPLHPLVNGFMCDRWQLNSYCDWYTNTFLSDEDGSGHRYARHKGIVTFVVKGGSLRAVDYGDGYDRYGDVNALVRDTEQAVQTYCRRASHTATKNDMFARAHNKTESILVSMGRMMEEGFGLQGTYFCTMDNTTGILNLWSPLFPKLTTVSMDMGTMGSLTSSELKLLPGFTNNVVDFVQGHMVQNQ